MISSTVTYSLEGTINTEFGQNDDVTPPSTSVPAFGTLTLNLQTHTIVEFNFDNYNELLTGKKLDADGIFSQIVDQDTSYEVTIKGDTGEFSAKSLQHGTNTQFISVTAQAKRLATITVDVA
jgi:hypothetical protein